MKNIRKMFEDAIVKYKEDNPDSPRIDLFFKTLSAGYGQHLFNQIARDIISADIAVFDISDLNPNVMIEVGVALTWGVRVLLIKEKTASKVPSDISGQTWAEYTKDGMEFTAGHKEKLFVHGGICYKKETKFVAVLLLVHVILKQYRLLIPKSQNRVSFDLTQILFSYWFSSFTKEQNIF